MEQLDFCIADTPCELLPVQLDAVYCVFADDTYDVHHRPIRNSLVLVHTLSGEGQLEIGDGVYVLPAGCTFLFSADCGFHYFCRAVGWNFWWFEFRCEGSLFPGCPMLENIGLPMDAHLLYLAEESLNHLKMQDVQTASALFTALLCLVGKKSHTVTVGQQNGRTMLRQADRYIRRHLDCATVASTAAALGVSTRTLNNLFRQLVGVSPVVYIQNRRTDMVRHLLQVTDRSIKDIAASLGYADQFVLSKSFRKRFGISPSTYRRSLKTAETSLPEG